MKRTKVFSILSIATLATAGVLAGATPAAADTVTDEETPANVVVYWGVDSKGDFFQTEVLDADDPANQNVVNPATLPRDETAEPTVTKPDGTVTTGDEARAELKTEASKPQSRSSFASAAGGAFVCSQFVSGISKGGNSLTGSASQTCTGSYTKHWIEVQIQREYAWYQVSYSPWRTWSSTVATSYTWNLLGDCGTDGTTRSGKLRWNIKPHANSTNGTSVTGGEVYGEAKSVSCGWGITQ